MICEICHGTGFVRIAGGYTEHRAVLDACGIRYDAARAADRRVPCGNCGGTGIQSCCEGAVGGPCDVTNEGASDE